MWWLAFFPDADYVCYPETLTTNLGHVCEIVVEVSRPTTVTMWTPRGPVGPITRCHDSEVATPDGRCERKSFIVKYEWVISYYTPYEFVMPMKGGAYRFPHLVYTCGATGSMNGHGLCERAYERRMRRK